MTEKMRELSMEDMEKVNGGTRDYPDPYIELNPEALASKPMVTADIADGEIAK